MEGKDMEDYGWDHGGGQQGREDLYQLIKMLDLDEETFEEGPESLVVPENKQYLLCETFTANGATRLMLAANSGDTKCVHLLLRCGANVDDLDKRKKSAIDYAIGHPEIILLLLRWDSLIPVGDGREEQGRSWMTNPHIEPFFAEREEFHRLLKDEKDTEPIRGVLTSTCNSMLARNKPKRWVNSEGKSALYTAIMNKRYETWALLHFWSFVYANEEEKDEALKCENDLNLQRCVAECSVAIQGIHVDKMLQKIFLYGGKLSEFVLTQEATRIYREINDEEIPSDILKCLQDCSTLTIIIDFSSGEMYPKNCKYRELDDFSTNRIYVDAMESADEKNTWCYVLSNLIHELAHKAIAVVFDNDGLPFRKNGDQESLNFYEEVVTDIYSTRFDVTLDPIIRRAFDVEREPRIESYNDLSESAKKKVMKELIVRVPEMIVKHKKSGEAEKGNDTEGNGFCLLKTQVPQLMEFYEDFVAPAIKEYIKRNNKAGKAHRSELLCTPKLLSKYWIENASIHWESNEINSPCISFHKNLRVVVVSNLSLGISHLKFSSPNEKMIFVDWSKYLNSREYFHSVLDRGDVTSLVILWDFSKDVPFCWRKNSSCANVKCPGKILEDVFKHATLMVPRLFCPKNLDCKPNDYNWKNLSMKCKEWLRRKELKLWGKHLQLMDIVKAGCGGNEEEAENFLDESFDEEDISALVNKYSVTIGSPLTTVLKDMRTNMLHGRKKDFEPRDLRLRGMILDKKFINKRENDAFVLMHMNIVDLDCLNLGRIPKWDCSTQSDNRCFSCSLNESRDTVHRLIDKISKKIMNEAVDSNKRWKYIHFFRLEGGKSVNLCSFKCHYLDNGENHAEKYFNCISLWKKTVSNEALIIADAPGSGKSVFIQELARKWKKLFHSSWVDVVDLPQFEESFKELKFQSELGLEEVLNILHIMVKAGNKSIEKKLLKLFCAHRKKVIIFFDGFDEICTEYRKVVTSFLKTLVNNTLVQVVVTTRTHECEELEESLSTLAYALVPFDRAKIVQFMRKEWIASLLLMPQQERSEKINTIAKSLEKNGTLSTEDRPSFVESLHGLHPSRKYGSSDVNNHFDSLAEKLLAAVESKDSEEKLTETPLHIWMLSSVAFEENFNLLESLSVFDLHDQFFRILIQRIARQENPEPFLARENIYEFLKKMSASFFTGDIKYEMNWKENIIFRCVGIFRERKGRIAFTHQTFAEYFFSMWLLENAETEKVTELLLSEALQSHKFKKVRQFMEFLLRSKATSNTIALEGRNLNLTIKIAEMNRSAFHLSSAHLLSCLSTCLFECNTGILGYIYRNSGKTLHQVVLGKGNWRNVEAYHSVITKKIVEKTESPCKDAFFLLCQCLSEFLFRSLRNKTSCLIIWNKMQFSSLDYDLILRIYYLLVRGNHWWRGCEELLNSEQGGEEFRTIFELLIESKDLKGETLVNILSKYICGFNKLRKVSAFAFVLNVYFFGSISRDAKIENDFLLGDDFHVIVLNKNKSNHLDDEMWSFLNGNLTMEEQINFLAAEKLDVNLATFLNKVDESVMEFVWKLWKKEPQDKKFKALIIDGIGGQPRHLLHRINYENPNVFYKWLSMTLSVGFFTCEEVIQILINAGKSEDCIMFRHPSLVFAFQKHLLHHKHARKLLCDVGKRFYDRLAECCLMDELWCVPDFVEHVEAEWTRLSPDLPSWVKYIVEEDAEYKGILRHVKQESNEHQVPLLAVKAYVVLLKEQLTLERKFLGDEFLKHLEDNWKFEQRNFPIAYFCLCGNWYKTASVFVGLFFGVMAKFGSRDVVEKMLVGDAKALAVVKSMMQIENKGNDLQVALEIESRTLISQAKCNESLLPLCSLLMTNYCIKGFLYSLSIMVLNSYGMLH